MPNSATGSELGVGTEQPRRVGSPVIGAPFSAEMIIEDKPLLANGLSGAPTRHRVLVYRNSEGKKRVETLAPAEGGQGEKRVSAEITDPTTRVSDLLDFQHHLDRRMTLEGMLMVITGCCPEKAVALQSSEIFVLTAAEKPVPVGGPGWRGNGFSVELINNIDGFTVEGYGNQLTLPEGVKGNKQAVVITTKIWYAPEIKLPLLIELSDSRHGDSKIKLNNIQ